jgi:hypothetical protein
VFALAAGWGITIWEGLHKDRAGENLELRVRGEGEPYIRRDAYDGYYRKTTFHAMDGSELPRRKYQGSSSEVAGASLAMPRRDRVWDRLGFSLNGNTRVAGFADGFVDGPPPPHFWYFLHDGARDGRGYFVGYDSQSKLCVGFIGRDGFRPDQPPVEQWFPMDGAKLASGMAFSRYTGAAFWADGYTMRRGGEFPAWKVEMISGAELLEVDLRTGSVTTLMESADLVAVGMLIRVSTWTAAGEHVLSENFEEKLAVRTTDRLLVFDAPGKQRFAHLLPEELRDQSIVLYEWEAGTALLTASRTLPDRSRRAEVLWIDAPGRVLRRAEVSLGGGDARYDEIQAWKSALIVPAPVILAFLATVTGPLEHLASGLEPNYPAALARCLAAWWPALLVVALLAAALAWYCCRRHRRYYQPASGVWLVFVLLTGLPGLVAYLFHRRWPVLEKCPTCGHDVPRDRETCAKCGTTFPAPEPKGCEVFA